jgi:hypothetical protein
MSRSQESAIVNTHEEAAAVVKAWNLLDEFNVSVSSMVYPCPGVIPPLSRAQPFQRVVHLAGVWTHGLTVFAYSYSGSSVRYVTQR